MKTTVDELDNVGEAVTWMLSGGNAQQVSWGNVAASLAMTRRQHAELVVALEAINGYCENGLRNHKELTIVLAALNTVSHIAHAALAKAKGGAA